MEEKQPSRRTEAEAAPPTPSSTPVRVLDRAAVAALVARLHTAVRARHFSPHTERAYEAWTRRFIVFHRRRDPVELGVPEIRQFLGHLAEARQVSPSTQNQALNAVLFLYREVLGRDPGRVGPALRARGAARAPLVLSRQEVESVLQHLRGTARVMVALMYGSGLRLSECCRLRVRDLDFALGQLTVRDGKGERDRVTLPCPLVSTCPCRNISRQPRSSTRRTVSPEAASSPCRPRSFAPAGGPAGTGVGSGSSRRRGRASTVRRESPDAVTCTRASCSASSRSRFVRPG